MLSKNKVSEITALQQKKFRQSSGLFVVEGEKMVDELLASDWDLVDLYATAELYEKYLVKNPQLLLATGPQFEKISSLKTPAGILAVARQKTYKLAEVQLQNNFTLCLDGVRDPGNLGTIIRIADWFGIKNIVCSEDTVDVYNAKTIQSTMGSFLRVQVIYTDLVSFLDSAKAQHIPVFGAVLNGTDVYTKKQIMQGVIVMGSESKGLRESVLACIDEPITIPSKLLQHESEGAGHSIDSLNVAVATSVICAIFAGQMPR